jgi:hypothetical protein
MSIDVMSWVWRHSQSVGNDRLVLLAIADNAEDDGTNAWPKQATLARKTRLSEDTVRRATRRLIELGELEVDERAGGSDKHEFYSPRHRPHSYRVIMTPQPAGSVTPQPAGSDPANSPIRDPAPCMVKLEEPSEGQPSVEPSFENLLSTDVDTHFAEFWSTWPKRNGKKLGRSDAERCWAKLTSPERDAALTGAAHYAAASDAGLAGAMDAHRWLTHRHWTDWQTPAHPDRPHNGQRPPTGADAGMAILRRRGVIR